MFYGVFKENGEYVGGVYDGTQVLSTICEEDNVQLVAYFDLKVYGKTYGERKSCIEDQAHIYDDSNNLIDLSYGELAILGDYFEKNGKKYGLYREFKENAIC